MEKLLLRPESYWMRSEFDCFLHDLVAKFESRTGGGNIYGFYMEYGREMLKTQIVFCFVEVYMDFMNDYDYCNSSEVKNWVTFIRDQFEK